MKAVGQRQLPVFLLASESDMPLPLGEKAAIQLLVRARTPARDSPGLGPTWCQEPGKGMSEHRQRPGTAGMPAAPHRTQHQTFKHCQRGSILKENSLG